MPDGNGIRSEQPSLNSLSQALGAIKKAENPDELAELLMLSVELYADGRCLCEEKAAGYGEGDGEVRACNVNANRGRDELLAVFRELAQSCGVK